MWLNNPPPLPQHTSTLRAATEPPVARTTSPISRQESFEPNLSTAASTSTSRLLLLKRRCVLPGGSTTVQQPTGVRVFEGFKEKVEDESQYDAYVHAEACVRNSASCRWKTCTFRHILPSFAGQPSDQQNDVLITPEA